MTYESETRGMGNLETAFGGLVKELRVLLQKERGLAAVSQSLKEGGV